jgi:ATP-binding cassette, subfamily B (MDR/TAP), member 1
MGAFSAGLIFQFAPDIGKAKKSALTLKQLFESKPKIDPRSDAGLDPGVLQGHVELKHVFFRYPSRPEQLVLKDVSLEVKPGRHVALVGETGCGKSTIISLIERFYDPTSGVVQVGGHNISSLNVSKFRRTLGLVSQEPTLYDGTIRDNLLVGLEKDKYPDEQIESVCSKADVLEFIQSLP